MAMWLDFQSVELDLSGTVGEHEIVFPHECFSNFLSSTFFRWGGGGKFLEIIGDALILMWSKGGRRMYGHA
jgi:hypothetical protein